MSRRTERRQGSRPSRVGDQLLRELSDLLHRELRDPRIGLVTLTAVDVSPDFSHAKVYFSCLERDHAQAALAGLERAKGFLRSQLAKRMTMYAMPELRFVYDVSIERGDRISRLLDGLDGPSQGGGRNR